MADLERIASVIADSGVKKEKVASVLGISPGSLYNKLNGRTDFTVGEANTFCDFFGITEERERLFFAPKVEENINTKAVEE